MVPSSSSISGSVVHTSTPPTSSTIDSKPAKSMPTKWPIRRPDIFWMTFTRHFGPPSAYVAFSLSPSAAG